MAHFTSFRRVLVAAFTAAVLAVIMPQARAGSIVYSFKLKNQTAASAYDYHLTVTGQKAANITLNSSSVNGQAWVNRPVTQAGAAVNFGWSTNSQQPKNPLANAAFGTFTFTVNNNNNVKVVKSQWSDNNGDPLGAATAAPSFATTAKDPIFTFSNQLTDSVTFGIQNLQFEVNVPGISPSLLDPDVTSAFDPNLPHFALNQNDSMDFTVSGAISPGNWDYASGQVVDTSGAVDRRLHHRYPSRP